MIILQLVDTKGRITKTLFINSTSNEIVTVSPGASITTKKYKPIKINIWR